MFGLQYGFIHHDNQYIPILLHQTFSNLYSS